MTKEFSQPGNPAQSAPQSSRKSLAIAVSILLAFLGLTVLGYQLVQDNSLATLVELSGEPERDTAASVEQWVGAALGDRFEYGDGARTSEHAGAQFRMLNGALLTLRPSSTLRFHRRDNRGGLSLDVAMGEIELLTAGGTMSLGSEFGEITLDPNSRITLSRQSQVLSVSVALGQIRLGGKGQLVAVGQSVSLSIGGIVFDPREKAKPAVQPESEVIAPPELSLPEVQLGDGTLDVDLLATAGGSFVIHDPHPPTAVAFNVEELCDGPASLSASGKTTQSLGVASLALGPGRHRYEVRCLSAPDTIVARGRVRIIKDSGRRKLPRFAPRASVVTDGRLYSVMYQSKLPKVTVAWDTAPDASQFVLEIDGRKIETDSAKYTFSSLKRGRHRVAFLSRTTPPRKSRVTTINVVLDRQAPTARVSSPRSGFEPGDAVTVGGQALPGWQVAIGGQALPVDSRRRFSTQIKAAGPFAIAFSHPQRGIHYYLRRPKASPP